jgi:hypothetical protein
MFLPKEPEGFQYGLMFSLATGKQLDVYGERYNMPRKFLEPSILYKRRLAKQYIELMKQRNEE